MQKASLVIAERIESVIDLFGKVASWLTLSIVLLIVVNVILRYSMSLGSVWAQELEWHLLAAMILFGISFSLLRGDNVRVDLFYANYTPQKKYIVDLVSAILTIIIAVFFVKLSINYVGQSFSIGEKCLSKPSPLPSVCVSNIRKAGSTRRGSALAPGIRYSARRPTPLRTRPRTAARSIRSACARAGGWSPRRARKAGSSPTA